MTDEAQAVPYLTYGGDAIVDKDGKPSLWFINAWNNLILRTGTEATNGILGIINGQTQANADAAAQIAAANAAAQAAITASGSTVVDYDTDSSIEISSGTYATFITNTLTQTGGGNYEISALLNIEAITTTSPLTTGTEFYGNWQVVENPNAHVLASGNFTITTTYSGGEGGSPYYSNSIEFGTALPSLTSYGDNETGAVTIELQLRRASGSNTASMMSGTMLTSWS